MNNNIFINNLKQKKSSSNTDSKYNPDVDQQYNKLINTRSNREFEYSNTMWKPIIGSINKANINSNDLKIDIQKSNQSEINISYEKELANRKAEQELVEKTLNNNSKLDELKINIDENLIKINNNFDDLKKLATNTEKTTIMDSITKLDDLLSSIKKL